MPTEVSQAAPLDRPAFSTFERPVDRLRVEVYVRLYDDAASRLSSIRHNTDLIIPVPDLPPAVPVVAFRKKYGTAFGH